MDPFAAPSTVGSNGSPATLSLSTESDAGPGAMQGSRVGVVSTSNNTLSVGPRSAERIMPMLGSRSGVDEETRTDEPSVNVSRAVATIETTQTVPVQRAPAMPTPPQMYQGRYVPRQDLLRPKPTGAAPLHWRIASGPPSPASSVRSVLSDSSPHRSSQSDLGPRRGVGQVPKKLATGQEVRAQLRDRSAQDVDATVSKRKIDNIVEGIASGRAVDLGLRPPRGHNPEWFSRVPDDEPEKAHTPEPKTKNPKLESTRGPPDVLAPAVGTNSGPQYKDIWAISNTGSRVRA